MHRELAASTKWPVRERAPDGVGENGEVQQLQTGRLKARNRGGWQQEISPWAAAKCAPVATGVRDHIRAGGARMECARRLTAEMTAWQPRDARHAVEVHRPEVRASRAVPAGKALVYLVQTRVERHIRSVVFRAGAGFVVNLCAARHCFVFMCASPLLLRLPRGDGESSRLRTPAGFHLRHDWLMLHEISNTVLAHSCQGSLLTVMSLLIPWLC